ncbi:MAG: DUF5722 domain-containing protein [Anaerolineae bacterium]|nr:DUF5722 domain-containing protein [Anaerolineae bacterium]
MITGSIEKIVVEQAQIQVTGTCSSDTPADVTLYLYDLPPYASEPGDRQPITSISLHVESQMPFTINIPRFAEGHDRLYSQFRMGSATPAGTLFSGVCYATNLQDIAAYDYPYPQAHTIKGLQVHDVEDAIQLGIAHAALNLNQSTIMRPRADESTITYRTEGQEFYFDRAYLEQFDAKVKELSDNGIIVYLIMLNSLKWDDVTIDPDLKTALVHPDYDPEGFISAFNVVTDAGLAHYKAFFEFAAERYSRPDQQYGRVSGYIIGNEVDAQWIWSNAGEKTVEAYMREYANAVRIAFYAARKQYSQARVYLSLTHHWTLPHTENQLRTYRGRDIIEIMNQMSTEEGNFDWSIAYHPYPEDLAYNRFWEDANALDTLDTPLITFKNIDVLSRYLSQPHLLFDGRIRHIILSEQGLHSDENEESERIQAAGYAYAYWKIAHSPGIQAFIYHAHIDHRDEFDLNLGIRHRDKSSDSPNAPGTPKPVYEVFKGIDGPEQEAILDAAKAVIGEEFWL